MNTTAIPPEINISHEDEAIKIILHGDWVITQQIPDTAQIFSKQFNKDIQVDSEKLGEWDSRLIAFLVNLKKYAVTQNIQVDFSSLPEGSQRLLNLAFAVEEREGARKQSEKTGLFTQAGQKTLDTFSQLKSLVNFIGEITLSLGRFFRGKANYQRSDLWVTIQETGAEAFPIVSLIAFLVGAILAFVGVVQLNKFGAGIYVADLVAVGVVREMGAIMTGIIMAGRTGAAFAAQLGTMKVNEEIDALTTMGIDPIDYLVLPKLIALIIMLPLLTIYANFLGILGGAFVALTILDISAYQYMVQTMYSVQLIDFTGGLFKATVYGVLIAVAGCRCGIECGNGSAAVGLATTSAVVSGIVAIVLSNAVINIIYTIYGI